MGAPAVTTTSFRVPARRESTRMRRTGIWLSVVGAGLTLVGALTVVLTRGDSDPSAVVSSNSPASSIAPAGHADTATTVVGAAATDRRPGAVDAGPQPVTPASPTAPPPATPQEVAELLAGLPQQLQQAADSTPQPHELTPEEVNKIVDDLLRQLGAKP